MKGLFAVPAMALNYQSEVLNEGTLSIKSQEENTPMIRLGLDGKKLIANGALEFFSFYDETLQEGFQDQEFLGVDEEGKLKFLSAKHNVFELELRPPSPWDNRVFLGHKSTFQVCGDLSIAYNSTCDGAKSVEIFYEIDWPPAIYQSRGK